MTKYRPRIPVTRVMDPKMRSMARRNLRGVGMNGMGMISTARVVVRLNDSVVMAWLRYDEHCAVITSVNNYKWRREPYVRSFDEGLQ